MPIEVIMVVITIAKVPIVVIAHKLFIMVVPSRIVASAGIVAARDSSTFVVSATSIHTVVIATAYDITGASKYRDGAVQSMDNILGRNALNISYVTGYGDVAARQLHSRWYAHQLDPNLPSPPDGTLAGGPNSSIQDPLAQAKLKDCVGQFCYIDDIQSWSTNETAINWNAALARMASFVADQG